MKEPRYGVDLRVMWKAALWSFLLGVGLFGLLLVILWTYYWMTK